MSTLLHHFLTANQQTVMELLAFFKQIFPSDSNKTRASATAATHARQQQAAHEGGMEEDMERAMHAQVKYVFIIFYSITYCSVDLAVIIVTCVLTFTMEIHILLWDFYSVFHFFVMQHKCH